MSWFDHWLRANPQRTLIYVGRDFDAAEQMLREATEEPLLRDYAALLLARNKLDAEIARVRGKAFTVSELTSVFNAALA